MICDRNCAACREPDCCVDESDYTEICESRARDHEIFRERLTPERRANIDACRRYYAKHREQILQQKKAYYAENREPRCAYQAEYRKAHREELRAYERHIRQKGR